MQYSGITKTPALACSPNKKEWAKPVLYLIGFFSDHFRDKRSFFLLMFYDSHCREAVTQLHKSPKTSPRPSTSVSAASSMIARDTSGNTPRSCLNSRDTSFAWNSGAPLGSPAARRQARRILRTHQWPDHHLNEIYQTEINIFCIPGDNRNLISRQ